MSSKRWWSEKQKIGQSSWRRPRKARQLKPNHHIKKKIAERKPDDEKCSPFKWLMFSADILSCRLPQSFAAVLKVTHMKNNPSSPTADGLSKSERALLRRFDEMLNDAETEEYADRCMADAMRKLDDEWSYLIDPIVADVARALDAINDLNSGSVERLPDFVPPKITVPSPLEVLKRATSFLGAALANGTMDRLSVEARSLLQRAAGARPLGSAGGARVLSGARSSVGHARAEKLASEKSGDLQPGTPAWSVIGLSKRLGSADPDTTGSLPRVFALVPPTDFVRGLGLPRFVVLLDGAPVPDAGFTEDGDLIHLYVESAPVLGAICITLDDGTIVVNLWTKPLPEEDGAKFGDLESGAAEG
jgi:hypothetical protein